MLQAFAVSPADAAFNQPAPPDAVSPRAVREAAAELVAANQLTKALRLVDEALREHPQSQDLLAMMALICEVRHDWPRACDCLEQLIRVQGQAVSAESLGHYVRVLRCDGRLQRALTMAQRGLQIYPDDAMLESEYQTLLSMGANQSQASGV